ncbi:MAG: glucose-1-phosphate adenylyltransferase [Anaerolineales bacterium]|nr:glucose-1-phosphate adenylyltransferase [Anaerolineales bacterium]
MSHDDVLGLVLGGGRGTRLWPLTKLRAKPAVPIAGKYRLIDIPLSNCLNSDIHQIAILTQFNSVSLHRHIAGTYNFDLFHPGWVQILAAEQTLTSTDWYQGTADAVRKQLFEIQVTGARDVLVLAGDHLYRMDFEKVVEFHREKDADITVAVKPVSDKDASRFGILKLDKGNLISDFIEKPQKKDELEAFVSREDPEYPYLGSMGIYLFRMQVLVDLLVDSVHDDFGHDVIPDAIETQRVFGYTFDGYWEDIGTMRTFYEANLALTDVDPPFSFHDLVHPIYTHPRFLPGSRIYDVSLDRVLLSDGCIVEGAQIKNAVIGIRSVIGDHVVIEDTIIMGADYYEAQSRPKEPNSPPIGIGFGSNIRGAIIDKNARIGPNVRIAPFPQGTDIDDDRWSIRDGLVVIPKSTVIREGTVIGPD